jgi:peptidoglycan/LPS O-acetylase OafA/YrhL
MSSPGRDNLLEKGYWEEVKTDLPPTQWQNARASKWGMDFLRPSFLTRTQGQRKQSLRRTAYLDGLRGFAAFMVYWHHHHLWSRDATHGDRILDNGFGYDNQYYFVCFPGIRTFFNGGHYAVSIFFVVSGYVLSAKPLSLIYAGDYLKLGDNLASALFRRWIRLHLPIIATTFLYMTSWHAFGLWTEDAIHQQTYRAELWTWYTEFKNFSFVFRTGSEPVFSYNFHVWSIPVEFRGSLIIYTAAMAFSRCTKNARLLGEVGLITYFLYIADGWFGSLFMSGMLLYDLDQLAENKDLPSFISKMEPFKTFLYYVLFVVSVYLGGVPGHTADVQVLRETPGWYYLSFLKPQAVFDYKWFYLFWASTFLVAAIPRISWLKSFFENRFNQYLGRICFSLYLVHGPVLWILGNRFYSATGYARETHTVGIPDWINAFPLSRAGPFGFDLAFWLPHLILLPLTLWLAELVTKTIDEPSVRFAAWLYKKALPTPGKS